MPRDHPIQEEGLLRHIACLWDRVYLKNLEDEDLIVRERSTHLRATEADLLQ